MKETEQFLQGVFDSVQGITRQTVEHFGGEKANQFIMIGDDGLTIASEIMGHYKQDEQANLLFAQLWGLVKEFRWLQLLFLAGNYPLVKSRLRYLWEVIYRACLVETHDDPAVRTLGPDEKLEWMEDQKLNWNTCIRPVLFKVFPLAEAEAEVLAHYRSLWNELNSYVHPSQYVQCRMIDDSLLLMTDSFDSSWAEDTLRAGMQVADLLWLAVLCHYEKAIPSVAAAGLNLEYHLTGVLLRS